MNALLRKEIRLSLPAWIAAMVLAIVPVWFVWPGSREVMAPSPGIIAFGPFGLGLLLLAITPIGQELSLGTFSILLAQPIPRRRLWLAKITVLALGLLLAFVAFAISNHFRVDAVLETMKSTVWRNAFNRPKVDPVFLNTIAEIRRTTFRETLIFGGVSVLAAFAGGLWTTLLLRQVSAAFWLTFLVPMGLGLVGGKLLSNFPDIVAQTGLCVLFGVYSVAGFVWAKRLFFSAQDVQWTGGVVSLPVWRRSAVLRESAPEQQRMPLRALLRKEFRLQHINLLLAAGLLLLHGAAVLIRRLNADYFVVHRSEAMILESVPLLWMAMPLLVGSVAIAEERKLGTLEGFLCLPTNRRLQFVMKLVLAMSLGIFFGGVTPLLVEWLGNFLAPSSHPSGLAIEGEVMSVVTTLLFGSAGITLLSLYASTLTHNTLQALGGGLIASVTAWLIISEATTLSEINDIVLWQGRLVGIIGLPVMIIIILLLAYKNYKNLQPDWRTWLRNISILILSLACAVAATTIIYHRAWEAWLPEEPLHHYTPPSPAAGRRWYVTEAKLQATRFRTALVLPDGRLWLRQKPVGYDKIKINGRTEIIPREKGWWHSGFVSGSDWREVAVSQEGCYAIKKDGTLWDVSDFQPGKRGAQSGPKQVGESHDWQKISAGWNHFCALKSDGTVWEWGFRPRGSGKSFQLEKLSGPSRVGSDSDWADISDGFTGVEASLAIKNDGSIWRWGLIGSSNTNGSWLPQMAEQPERWLALPSRKAVSISYNGIALAVVCEDGSLWFGGNLSMLAPLLRAVHELVRWGNDSDWSEVKLMNSGGAIAINGDGSLWQWDTATWASRTLLPPTMVSRHSDWVTACPDGNGFLALARDGNLCLWGDPNDMFGRFNGPDPYKLLCPSSIKARRIAQFLR